MKKRVCPSVGRRPKKETEEAETDLDHEQFILKPAGDGGLILTGVKDHLAHL